MPKRKLTPVIIAIINIRIACLLIAFTTKPELMDYQN